jgi:hypothetical protein
MAAGLVSLSLAVILVLVLVASVNPQEVVTGPVKIYDTVLRKS